jgi:hypothetical protein
VGVHSNLLPAFFAEVLQKAVSCLHSKCLHPFSMMILFDAAVLSLPLHEPLLLWQRLLLSML